MRTQKSLTQFLDTQLIKNLREKYIDPAFETAKSLEEGIAKYTDFLKNKVIAYYPQNILEDGRETARYLCHLTTTNARYWKKEIRVPEKYITNSLRSTLNQLDEHRLIFILIDCISYFDCLYLLSNEWKKNNYSFDYRISTFPTITGSCITTIFTGRFPKDHNVYGNSYFGPDGEAYHIFGHYGMPGQLHVDLSESNLLFDLKSKISPYFVLPESWRRKAPPKDFNYFITSGLDEKQHVAYYDLKIGKIKYYDKEDDLEGSLVEQISTILEKYCPNFNSRLVFFYIPHVDRAKHGGVTPFLSLDKIIEGMLRELVKKAGNLWQKHKIRTLITSDHGSDYFWRREYSPPVREEKNYVMRRFSQDANCKLNDSFYKEAFRTAGHRMNMIYFKEYFDPKVIKQDYSTDHIIYLDSGCLRKLQVIEKVKENKPLSVLVCKDGFLLDRLKPDELRGHGGISLPELLVPYITVPRLEG